MNTSKTLIITGLILFSFGAFACGEYQARALVKMNEGQSGLVINPDTKSEINLKVDFNESIKLSPYIGRFIETLVKIEVPMDATRGEVSKLGPIKVLVPNPLASNKGTSLKPVNISECKK